MSDTALRVPAAEARSDALTAPLARVVLQRAQRTAAPGLDLDATVSAQHPLGNDARTPTLQRWPMERATPHRMSVHRLPGKDDATKTGNFAALRRSHTHDAHAIIEDLDPADVWGGLKSDITKTGDRYSVRMDRQNPTTTHSNIQIQTNGKSVTIATVLVDNDLGGAKPGALKHHVRAAFRASLADGMQWEVYNDARPL